MRNRFVSKFGQKPQRRSKLAPEKLGEMEKLFEFARKRYAAPAIDKEISYSYQPGRKPDSLTASSLKDELDAASFAIKDIRGLAAEARDTFNKRRMSERPAEARETVRHAIETDGLEDLADPSEGGIEAGIEAGEDDESRATSRRRRRRLGGLFRRR